MRNILVIFFSFFFFTVFAQMSDSFDDGDFTNNPTWGGNTDDFIVNDNLQLQLNVETAGESYLSTPHNLTNLEDKEWRFYIDYSFAGSNNNYGLTYLTATNADLSTKPDGIFFRIGENGSNDPIELKERKNGTETTIFKSTPGIVAQSFKIRVKIIHNTGGKWELYTDLTGGEGFQLDTFAVYPTDIIGSHIGMNLIYTSSNGKKFKYDDFYAGNILLDTIRPYVDTVFATSDNKVTVVFSEGVDQISAEKLSNYSINGIGLPAAAQLDASDSRVVKLVFSSLFTTGNTYTLTVKNVEDYQGNIMDTESKTFQYIEAQEPEFGDIIINEFIPKVSPAVGLPEVQFVELFNRSNKYIHLKNWKLSDNNSSGTIDETWLLPGQYLILTPAAGLEHYPQAVKVSGWAQLNQTGDEIHLATADGKIIDELTYTNAWYKDDDKKAGGWTIERINPFLPCSTSDNWRASNDPLGGTPGKQNSVYDSVPDGILPSVTNVEVIFPNQLTLHFSKGMDSLSLVNASFSTNPFLGISHRETQGMYPSEISFYFIDTLIAGNLIQFQYGPFLDCSGNSASYEGYFVLPEPPQLGDLIINEILFNPLTGGSDFVEIYNNSDKYIDLMDWELANYKDGEIANQKTIDYSYVLSPNDYVVITKDSSFQLVNYPFAIPGKFIQIPALPSYNNDSSTVLLLYGDSIMDKVSYKESWHFSLLNSKKGVSLERFSADKPSNSSSNWHSASESVGFATPGKENSQVMNVDNEGGTLTLSSNTFSPDGDGFEDVLILSYELTTPNLTGNLRIYDDRGRLIKTLYDQHLFGTSGSVKWEGTKDDGSKANIGPHIILFELFNLDSSKVTTIRKVVTVAGRM